MTNRPLQGEELITDILKRAKEMGGKGKKRETNWTNDDDYKEDLKDRHDQMKGLQND
jgi:hypothetical protein